MYLTSQNTTLRLQLGNVVSNWVDYHVSYQDITSTGMVIPQSSQTNRIQAPAAGQTIIVPAPAASTTRQVTFINVYNGTNQTIEVVVLINIGAVNSFLSVINLKAKDSITWTRENGWVTFAGQNTQGLNLTTIGSIGAATLIDNTLNVPVYDGSVEIPRLNVKTGKFDSNEWQTPISFSYYPTVSNTWKTCSPQIWLFRLLKRKRKKFVDANNIQQVKFISARWGHPNTDQWQLRDPIINRQNVTLYQHGIPNSARPRVTEWDIPNYWVPYETIPNATVNLHSFFSIYDSNINGWVPSEAGLYPTTDQVAPTRRSHSRVSGRLDKSALFLFRIAIRDPKDNTKLIFGPPSAIVKAMPGFNGDGIVASLITYRGL